jgi:hypothetical protein
MLSKARRELGYLPNLLILSGVVKQPNGYRAFDKPVSE